MMMMMMMMYFIASVIQSGALMLKDGGASCKFDSHPSQRLVEMDGLTLPVGAANAEKECAVYAQAFGHNAAAIGTPRDPHACLRTCIAAVFSAPNVSQTFSLAFET
jgi:hypothetical protein